MKSPRYWLAFANETLCNHAKSFADQGFVSWRRHRVGFQQGDIVYILVSDRRYVRFKTVVEELVDFREDLVYWNKDALKKKHKSLEDMKHPTYRLRLIEENVDNEKNLSQSELALLGYSTPQCGHLDLEKHHTLKDYILQRF